MSDWPNPTTMIRQEEHEDGRQQGLDEEAVWMGLVLYGLEMDKELDMGWLLLQILRGLYSDYRVENLSILYFVCVLDDSEPSPPRLRLTLFSSVIEKYCNMSTVGIC
ncbi:hypothetical protein L1987_56372 [Smallanthus sonchifolius]|uniref:Uncharacterized protein n=1 Tax=Smallanthus sonchifolius TaxID=185202 RepID=A0ACB9EDM0_9ASTR|nr:hypothetical protein L1987_56372 [Smallanthus sonchifolius]